MSGKASASDIDARLQRLEDVLQAILRELEALKTTTGQTINITVEKVDIEKVNLEQLSFAIEGIDVKDLSGTLNIGVNLQNKKTTPPKEPEKPKKQEKTKPKSLKPSNKPGTAKVNIHYNL